MDVLFEPDCSYGTSNDHSVFSGSSDDVKAVYLLITAEKGNRKSATENNCERHYRLGLYFESRCIHLDDFSTMATEGL